MKVALSWLEKFVQLPPNLSAKEIAEALTLSTVEVEEVVDLSEQFNNMVVGKIVEIKPHPNADKLRLAMTDIGGGEINKLFAEEQICLLVCWWQLLYRDHLSNGTVKGIWSN